MSAVTHPPPGVADRPERPPRRPTSPLLRKRHRAAFDHYAAPDGRVPIDAVVLALADLGSFDDDVDAELAGRLVAAHFNRGDGVPGVPGVARERFRTLVDVLDARRAAGHLGAPGSGAPALVAPEFFELEPLRALFRAAADAGGRLRLDAFVRTLELAGLLLSAKEGVAGTSSVPLSASLARSLSAAGASVIFARARGPAPESDDALLWPSADADAARNDFVCALARVAAARREPFGVVVAKLLASPAGVDAPAPSIQTLTAKDFGASAGFTDDAETTLKHDLLAERVTLADPRRPNAGAASSPRSSTSQNSKALESALASLRLAFGCMDASHVGRVPISRLAALLASAGATARVDLNTAATFARARVDALDPYRGRNAFRHVLEGEATLEECERHLRAAMKLRGGVAEAARSEARGGSARLSGRALRAVDDADASASPTARLRSAFERFAAAGPEAGFASKPHPKLMDLARFERFVRAAALHDETLEIGAECVAFGAACPPGCLRVDFEGFLAALDAVAAQKGDADGRETTRAALRARVANLTRDADARDRPRFALASREGGLARVGRTCEWVERPVERIAETAEENAEGKVNRDRDPSAVPPPAESSLPRRQPPRVRAAREWTAADLAGVVPDPEAAARVISSSAPIRADRLCGVLADAGALDGADPVAAGALIAGAVAAASAKSSNKSGGAGDDSEVTLSASEATRVCAAAASLRRGARRPPPPPTLRTYEESERLRRHFFAFACHGLSPREAERTRERLDLTWQRSVLDAEAAARAETGLGANVPRERSKKNPLQSAPPCDKNHAASLEPTPFLEPDRDARLGFACDPTRSHGADWPDAAQLLGRARELTDAGPGTRRVGFGAAYAEPRAFAARRTARAFGASRAEAADLARGLASEGVSDVAPGSKEAAARSIGAGLAGKNEGRWEAIHGADLDLDLETREAGAGERGERGSLGDLRAGLSLANFRKLAMESGVCDPGGFGAGPSRAAGASRLTPAAVDVVFAQSRAKHGGDCLTWGEYLRAVARVAACLGADVAFGAVAGAFANVGVPRERREPTPREAAAASGATARANDARRRGAMVRPWEESLRAEGDGGALAGVGGREAAMATDRATMSGVVVESATGTSAATPAGGAVATAATIRRAETESAGGARMKRGGLEPFERPRKPGALRASGSRAPEPRAVAAYLDAVETSKTNARRALERDAREAMDAREKKRLEALREAHEDTRDAFERAKRRTNAKDQWHFAEEVRALRRASGGRRAEDARGAETESALDRSARELTLTWLAETARLGPPGAERGAPGVAPPSLPFGVTLRDARRVAKVDPDDPRVATHSSETHSRGDGEPRSTVAAELSARRRRVMLDGRVGARVTIGAWAVGDAELESGERDSEEEEEEEEEARGGESRRALATSLAALRRTETKRVDPMASLVKSLRESQFYEAARG